MKKITITVVSILILSFGTCTLSCKKSDDPQPSVEEVQLTKLSKTWAASEVRLNNTIQTGYSNLTLTLAGSPGKTAFSYTVSGRPDNNPWPATGLWTFGNPVETKIIRDDGTTEEVEISYTVTESQLQLNFDFSGEGYSGSRISSVEGAWSFTFIPD